MEAMKLIIDVRDTIDPFISCDPEIPFQKFTEDCRKDMDLLDAVYRKIGRHASDRIVELIGSEISWTRSPFGYDASDKDAFLPGFLYPDELIAKAEGWNEEIVGYAANYMVKFLKHKPEDMPLKDYIRDMADFADQPRPSCIDLAPFGLWRAFAALDGTFVRGGSCYVIDDICGSHSTGISPKVMETIKEHPECYAFLLVPYRF